MRKYGSISHLIGSSLGVGDHHIHAGQHAIATLKTRDKHDMVIVQEKYDGANVAVVNIKGELIALTRAGRAAASSPYMHHRIFADWAACNKDRFLSVLGENERLCGEWILQAHGTLYKIGNEPFVAFDFFNGENERLVFSAFEQKISDFFNTPRKLWQAAQAVHIESMMKALAADNKHPIQSVKPEGVIYRVERKGKVDFLAKFVRHDFVPGALLPEISGQPAVFNFHFH